MRAMSWQTSVTALILAGSPTGSQRITATRGYSRTLLQTAIFVLDAVQPEPKQCRKPYGPEPDLHRIYVDPMQKRGGIGNVLMRKFHAWLDPGSSYILLVAEANRDAQAFYALHGLVTERRVNGPAYYGDAMSIELDDGPARSLWVAMRFTKQR